MARRTTLGTIGPSDAAPLLTGLTTPVPMSTSVVGAVSAAVIERRVCVGPVRLDSVRAALLDSGDPAATTTVVVNRIPAGSATATLVAGSTLTLTDAGGGATVDDFASVSQDFEIGDTIEIEVTAAGANAENLSVSLNVLKLFGDA